MKEALLVVDCQNDFVDGVLGSEAAKAIMPQVEEFVRNFDGSVYATVDKHRTEETMFNYSYGETIEGKNIPEHCMLGTDGAKLYGNLSRLIAEQNIYSKEAFMCVQLALARKISDFDVIHIIGLVTDICVVSNALYLRSIFPGKRIVCHANLCAGTTPENHEAALKVMKSCLIDIEY